MPVSFDPHIVMHCAAIISVAALALRDQLRLRAVLLVGILLSALYNDIKVPGPAWQELFWNGITFAINLKVLVQIVLDRAAIGFSPEEQELFAAFQMLSPGEFRSILKLATWRTAEVDEIITQQGVVPEYLYYVLRGTIHIEKSGRDLTIAPKTFIGEVGVPAPYSGVRNRAAGDWRTLSRMARAAAQHSNRKGACDAACDDARHQLRHGTEGRSRLSAAASTLRDPPIHPAGALLW